MARFINIHVAYVLLLLGAPSLAACTATAGNEPGAAAADIDDFRIDALSAKPHLVSGGDLLVRISMPPESVGVSDLAVTVGDRDLSAAFRPEDGREALLGIVDRLPLGDSRIVATLEGGDRSTSRSVRLDVTNYPITGPMISGSHESPYHCQTEEFELVTGQPLGAPTDDDCSVETRVDYVYRSSDDEETFKPLVADTLPDDLVEITTLDGHTVPFIVRVETGTVNRAVYEIAMIHDPREPDPDPWSRSVGWNGKLVYTHGGGCRSGWYQQGDRTGGVLREGLLEDGFAVTSATLNVYGQNCNDVLASETHMMVKERFIERYGLPVYTIGTGGSGGSYQSHLTADNYPGVFDGIIVRASFPDVASATIFTLADSRLLHYYFTSAAPGTFTKDEQRAVAGFREWGNLPNLSRGASRIDPVFDANTSPEEQGGEVSVDALEHGRYHPVSNPTGVRATVYDHNVNIFGVEPESGFAGRPLDNVGVQYGLSALQKGEISTTQFLDLNERIGGLDIDSGHVPQRHAANPHAARIAVETGRILNGGGGLSETPVIDYRTYTDDRENGDIHMKVHQHSTRARIAAANGHADNHVMAVGGRWGFTLDEPDLRTLFREMDQWLATLADDPSDRPRALKVVDAKPPTLVDHCWDTRSEPRIKVEERQTFDGPGVCNELYQAFPTPRHVAGSPIENSVVACSLTPLSRDQYTTGLTSAFTDDEWSRLQQIFPDGVCDWDQPGRYHAPYRGTWSSFGPSPVNLVAMSAPVP